jgi:hypothetical protein
MLSVVTLLSVWLASPSVAQSQTYRSTFVSLASGVPGLLYEPLKAGPKARIIVVAMHNNGDYLTQSPSNPCINLVKRGYRALCANASTSKSGFMSDDDEDKLMLNVKLAVTHARSQPAVRKVVIFGHSGGGGMMSAYQNIAENGLAACQGPEKLIKCPDTLAGLPAADGVMLIDSTLGTPGTTLFSLDPAVADDDSGQPLIPELDIYNPKNGFNPKSPTYSDEFIARFQARQGERENRLIAKAQDRLKKINTGQGLFTDDEPFIIPGAYPTTNKLNMQDMRLQAHTRNAWPLLHPDGSITTEIVHSVRVPRALESLTPSLNRGAITTTVRRFLNTYAVRTTPEYGFTADSLRGIDYHSSYAIELNSIEGITKPLLQMGMTGSHEFFIAETVREHAKSSDKSLAFVEGAVHGFGPCKECALAKGLPENYYGDTIKTLYDYIDGWLTKPGRF